MKNENADIAPLEGRFEGIYRQYSQRIYRFIYRLTGDPEETKDITQDAFVKLYHYMQKRKEPDDPRAWLFRVACNTCYTLLKTKERRRKIIENQPNEPSGNGVEDRFIREQEMNMVRKAFNQLPVQDRLILELYQSELPYREIARIIKVKPSTIGKKLFRARHKLAQKITGEEK